MCATSLSKADLAHVQQLSTGSGRYSGASLMRRLVWQVRAGRCSVGGPLTVGTHLTACSAVYSTVESRRVSWKQQAAACTQLPACPDQSYLCHLITVAVSSRQYAYHTASWRLLVGFCRCLPLHSCCIMYCCLQKTIPPLAVVAVFYFAVILVLAALVWRWQLYLLARWKRWVLPGLAELCAFACSNIALHVPALIVHFPATAMKCLLIDHIGYQLSGLGMHLQYSCSC
jgi:hypothetical protein